MALSQVTSMCYAGFPFSLGNRVLIIPVTSPNAIGGEHNTKVQQMLDCACYCDTRVLCTSEELMHSVTRVQTKKTDWSPTLNPARLLIPLGNFRSILKFHKLQKTRFDDRGDKVQYRQQHFCSHICQLKNRLTSLMLICLIQLSYASLAFLLDFCDQFFFGFFLLIPQCIVRKVLCAQRGIFFPLTLVLQESHQNLNVQTIDVIQSALIFRKQLQHV